MSQEASLQTLRRVVSQCWTDQGYKAKLLADPAGVFQAEGLPVPSGVELCVLENTAQVSYLVIPARPPELTDDALETLAGGAGLRDPLWASNKHKPRL